jgi:aminobenzoyl-glutamate utilization protein A
MLTKMETVDKIVREIEPRLIGYRRDFHRHAEPGWTEFRTASRVARALADLGYEVRVGRDVLQDEERLGLPQPGVIEEHWQRAKAQGADPEYLELLQGGFTGVVGLLRQGDGP